MFNKRNLYKWSRWLHIYVSTALFGLMLFFCFTGVVINHPEWMSDDTEHVSQTVTFDALSLPATPSRVQVEQAGLDWLNNHYQLGKVSSIEWFPEDRELIFDYSIPSGYLAATMNFEQRTLAITAEQGNWLVIMGELHKGRHSGVLWGWIIDISAVLMLLFSVTGLVLLYINRAKRKNGFTAVLLGTLAPFILYFLFVPHL